MSRYSLRFLLTSVGLGVAGGFGLALASLHLPSRSMGDTPRPVSPFGKLWVTAKSDGISFSTSCRATQNSGQTVATAAPSATDLWNKLMASTTESDTDFNTTMQLRKLAESDPRVRQDLMRRYGASDERGQKIAALILSQVPKPEVTDFATRLATAADASQRRDGFMMLSGLEMVSGMSSNRSEEIYALVSRALETEQDPSLLRQAIQALPLPGDIESAKTQATLQELANLTHNDDAQVRAQSIQAMAQWDRKGQAAEGVVYEALSDTQPEVRMAALSVIYNSPFRSDHIKSALLGVIANVNESADVKTHALNVLQRFPLSEDEYASYQQAREQVTEAE
jgi:hypothetical protein